MPSLCSPLFWRDPQMPYVELRKINDARQVCYALHSHEHWSLGAVTAGRSTFQYRDAAYAISAGDLVLMNPHWVHACNPIQNEPWAYLMLYVDTQWLTDLRYRAGLLAFPEWLDIKTAVISKPRLFDRYLAMADCLLNSQRRICEKQAALVDYLLEVMHALDQTHDQSQHKAPEELRAVAEYMNVNAACELSLDKICDFSGYSAGHLIRAFKQHYGLTPHAYLINRRIQLGQQELKQGKPIVEAALNAGFNDQPHFQRTFKRLVAATPNQYRQTLVEH
ncbi:helix-turn-helix transcriptional regulator [Vreelandella populi]|uniref:AraC family transcriptional regulator n=1 Tax=Vreelandella populi TaxID=2498858 RepID=A0A3S1EAC2_9GAMM|nr:AraC family transcriptional regulator [Halomonas populi]RUR40821.1 AraC family transcriptional regulator [Halomonas populi]RUR49328.1 AraC family transcriptional regulator [Halomonas populi]